MIFGGQIAVGWLVKCIANAFTNEMAQSVLYLAKLPDDGGRPIAPDHKHPILALLSVRRTHMHHSEHLEMQQL